MAEEKNRKPMSKEKKHLLMVLQGFMAKCFNANSTWTYDWGKSYEHGATFNYPVTYLVDGKKTKYPNLGDNPDEEILMTAYYAFGANQLPVYRNLKKILDYLEAHHGLKID